MTAIYLVHVSSSETSGRLVELILCHRISADAAVDGHLLSKAPSDITGDAPRSKPGQGDNHIKGIGFDCCPTLMTVLRVFRLLSQSSKLCSSGTSSNNIFIHSRTTKRQSRDQEALSAGATVRVAAAQLIEIPSSSHTVEPVGH